MKIRRLSVSLQIAAVAGLVFFAIESNATDTHEACQSVAAKLGAMYELETFDKFPSDDRRIRAAEQSATAFYGMPKNKLDAAWPGLYSWAVVMSLDGYRDRLTPVQFRNYAFAECLRRFS